jgi:hypothetical protein
MGLFNRKPKADISELYETETDRAERLRHQAIEYIVSLGAGDKDRFMSAVELIWQGYNALNRVKTVDERQEAKATKEARELSSEVSDLMPPFIETENGAKK